ncbi:flagellar hook-length control protein FliK [Brevundimonas sp. Root1279]|uniref:flagellar hook-length control protein FliK n=1 Tax=Brevundimonas sp. Root1279 TaxID=1736443 RepID=UPI000B28A1F9|nr:flagellar hook-length control protein FliK [Brevundimonas sp. Root1279]
MIASAVPAIPQGSTEVVDASGFEGILAGMMTSGAAKADALADKVQTDAGDEIDVALVPPGFLIAPVTLPLPLPPETTSGADASAAQPAPNGGAAAPELPASSVIAPPVEAAVAAGPPAAKADPTTAPQVLPDEAAPAVATPPPAAEPVAEGDPAVVTAAAVATTTKAATEALVAPTPPPAKPEPAPLRPLTERASKVVDTNALTAEPAAPGDARGAQAAAQPSAAPAHAPANDQPTKAAEAAPAVAAAATEQPPADTAEPLVGSSEPSASQTAATVREAATAPTSLSRVTIDATAQIAAQIIRKLDARSTRFEMALLPEELGRVDVKLDIDSEGRLQARLAFDNPAAATDLKGRADELRRQLEQQGFHLAEDAFEFADRDSGSSAFDRGQDARQNQGRAFAAAARLNNDTDVVQPRWMSLSLAPTGVDMKV